MDFTTATEAEQAFYTAFSTLDLKQMRRIWLDSPDASCLHPGGPLIRGRSSIMTSWETIFAHALPPDIRVTRVSAIEDAGLAVHTVEESIGTGPDQRALVIATNVFRLTVDGWRMLAHHAAASPDGPPATTPGPLH